MAKGAIKWIAYTLEYHVQGHTDVKAECPIIHHVYNKINYDKVQPFFNRKFGWFLSKFCCKYKPFQTDEKEMRKSH